MAETIRGRLGALSSAHQLIRPLNPAVHAGKQATTLGDLVRAVLSPHLEPFSAGAEVRVTVGGPDIPVGGHAATNIALVLHELATNAAKYGALSVLGGQVRISWSAADGRLALSWQEVGGPRVAGPPEHSGFGSLLARRSVSGQLAGDLIFHWNPEGLVVLVTVSTERLAL